MEEKPAYWMRKHDPATGLDITDIVKGMTTIFFFPMDDFKLKACPSLSVDFIAMENNAGDVMYADSFYNFQRTLSDMRHRAEALSDSEIRRLHFLESAERHVKRYHGEVSKQTEEYIQEQSVMDSVHIPDEGYSRYVDPENKDNILIN